MRQRPDWEALARGALAEFRTASARYPNDMYFEELTEDLKQISPEFCRWWPHHDAPNSMEHQKCIEHPTLGHLEFEHITLQVPNTPDVKVMIYTPLADTSGKLQQLLALTPL
jgi:hypothetical protein